MTDLDDFSDLEAIIAESEAADEAARRRKAAEKRLKGKKLSEDEEFLALAEIRLHENLFVWESTANIALFHTQHCLSCGHDHQFFMGWMTLQQHRRDPNCRRLVRGKAEGELPRRPEYHAQPEVEACSDCIEACIAIENAISHAERSIIPQGKERKDETDN